VVQQRVQFRGRERRDDFTFNGKKSLIAELGQCAGKVSLTVPSSAAKARLVPVSSILTGDLPCGFGQRFTSQFASRVSSSFAVRSSIWPMSTRR